MSAALATVTSVFRRGILGWLPQEPADALGNILTDSRCEVLVLRDHRCVGPVPHAHHGALSNAKQE
ncbi:MAG: hypothetical protein ACRDSR_16600 [Pseudonocardiaceae bacterium]